jgi:hypothetical protein
VSSSPVDASACSNILKDSHRFADAQQVTFVLWHCLRTRWTARCAYLCICNVSCKRCQRQEEGTEAHFDIQAYNSQSGELIEAGLLDQGSSRLGMSPHPCVLLFCAACCRSRGTCCLPRQQPSIHCFKGLPSQEVGTLLVLRRWSSCMLSRKADVFSQTHSASMFSA